MTLYANHRSCSCPCVQLLSSLRTDAPMHVFFPQMRNFLVASSVLFVFIGLVDICQLLNARNNIFDMLHGQGPTFSWSRFNATCAFDLISALLAVRLLFAGAAAARVPSRWVG